MIGLALILNDLAEGLMRAADLDIHELLHVVPEGGRITFAGARVLTIQGLVRAEVTRASLSPAAPGAEGIWHDSYEAEQHLLHLGQADEPVCWTLVGFASGYMSCVYGKEVIAIEDRCRGKGDT